MRSAAVNGSGSAVPTYNGCSVFPANDPVWNTNISAVAADPDSDYYVYDLEQALKASPYSDYIDYSHGTTYWIINSATSSDSTYSLTQANYSIEYGINDMRFASSFSWQGRGLQSDHHLMIVNSSNVTNAPCHVVEAYSSYDESGGTPSWKIAPSPHATAVVDEQSRNKALEYNLDAPFPTPLPTSLSQQGGGDVVLMGPMFPGLLRWEDYQNNTPHALELDVPNNGLLAGTFVYPAKVTCGGPPSPCGGTASYTPPLGTRLVLKTGVALPACISAGTCPVTAFVVKCLQDYGGYLADQENSGGLTIRFSNASDGSDPWISYGSDLSNLHNIVVNSNYFKVIPPPYCNSTIAACKGQNPPRS